MEFIYSMDKFNLMKEDLSFESVRTSYSMDISYLAQKVIGHDIDNGFEVFFTTNILGNNVIVEEPYLFIEDRYEVNTEDEMDIMERVYELFSSYL